MGFGLCDEILQDLWTGSPRTRNYRTVGLHFGLCEEAPNLVFDLSLMILLQRPFLNYYGPVFILYELSTPFLNVHWFCDKLNLTGSKIQWINGMFLLSSFFCCRLIWGSYQSIRVYQDVWHAINFSATDIPKSHLVTGAVSTQQLFAPRNGELCLGDVSCIRAQTEVNRYAAPGVQPVPIWLAGIYLICNITLHTLNFRWFLRMIETVSKRFQGKPHDEYSHERERKSSIVEEAARGLEADALSGPDEAIELEGEAMTTGRDDVDGHIEKRR